jgi:hypothetical protein
MEKTIEFTSIKVTLLSRALLKKISTERGMKMYALIEELLLKEEKKENEEKNNGDNSNKK